MSFQNPGAFLWLIPLAGAIILLYLLRMRRRDVRVPASFLWPERTEEVRANALIQKLRFSWLLILQLLALCVVVLAVAKPQTKQQGLAGVVTVFVLDASASMGASDVNPTRFEEAKRLAIGSIKGANAGDRLALIEAGPIPRVIFPLSGDPSRQLLALNKVQRYDSESDMGEAMRLASALVGSQDGARIVLLSDGCFDPIRNFSAGKAAVVYQQIGESNKNLAISALGTAETVKGRELFVGIRNFSLRDLGGTISLYADGKVMDSEKVSVKPGLQWGKTLTASSTAKVFEAKLEADDDLKSDNYAVSIADPGSSLRVLLVTKGDPFLERALALDPRVTLDRAAETPEDTGKYDVVIFDGVPEEPVQARGVLAFGRAGAASPVTDQGAAKGLKFVSAEKKPLMENVDLNGVYIDTGRRVKAKGSAEVIVTGSEGPLVVASRAGAQRHVYVAFEPLQSDFPLQISFPIFVANSLDYLGGSESASMLAVRAGSPFSLATPSNASLKDTEGDTTSVKASGGNLIVRDVRQVGVHSLTVEGRSRPVYSYLRSDRESNIEPNRDIQLGGGAVKAQQAPVRFADFWRPLALLSLLLLGAEWWLYARRS